MLDDANKGAADLKAMWRKLYAILRRAQSAEFPKFQIWLVSTWESIFKNPPIYVANVKRKYPIPEDRRLSATSGGFCFNCASYIGGAFKEVASALLTLWFDVDDLRIGAEGE